jgi:transporter family protein
MNWFSWSLLSALFAGLTAVLAKVGVEGLNSNVATAIRTAVVFVLTLSIAAPALRTIPLSAVNGRTWLFLIASGVATALSWLCYFRALQLGKASQVAPLDKMSTVLAVVLAFVFLHERLSLRGILGVALIVAGGLLMALERPVSSQ